MPLQQGHDVGSTPGFHRLEVSNRLSTPHHSEGLSVMLYGVQKVGEVSRRFGCADLGHKSDYQMTQPSRSSN